MSSLCIHRHHQHYLMDERPVCLDKRRRCGGLTLVTCLGREWGRELMLAGLYVLAIVGLLFPW